MREMLQGVALGVALIVAPMVGLVVLYRRHERHHQGILATLV